MTVVMKRYEVKAGDTLNKIAAHFHNKTSDLIAANPQIHNPDLILVGQVINIPSEEQAPSPPLQPVNGHPKVYIGNEPARETVSTNISLPVFPPLMSEPGDRSSELYDQVINQFAVGVNPRYQPQHGYTYCNIFLWDVTRAMGAEVPHWIDADGNPAKPFAQGAMEQLVNGIVAWMKNVGVPHFDWHVANASDAQTAANQGQPAIVLWKNPTGGHGHTAIVRPGEMTQDGPLIAQAGAVNFNVGHVKDSFGGVTVSYYVHA